MIYIYINLVKLEHYNMPNRNKLIPAIYHVINDIGKQTAVYNI